MTTNFNKLDGYIARKYNMRTLLGTIIDPAADKALMTVMTVTLTMEGVIPCIRIIRRLCS